MHECICKRLKLEKNFFCCTWYSDKTVADKTRFVTLWALIPSARLNHLWNCTEMCIYNEEQKVKYNTHLNYLMIFVPRLFAIKTKWMILAIEAIHVTFVSGCVDVSFAYGEECGGQELFQPWWRHQHQFLRKTNTNTVICSGQRKNMCVYVWALPLWRMIAMMCK